MRPDPKSQTIRLKGAAYSKFIWEVRRADRNRCVNLHCRHVISIKKHHNHHRISRGAGGSDVMENCFTLCPWCHDEVHRGNLILNWEAIHRRRNLDGT